MTKQNSILVVDDDREDHFILQEYFADVNLSHCLQFSANGKAALDLLDGLPPDNLPDAIVLDLNMPILNGTQTLLQLKRSPRYKAIPVIIYSTSENESDKRKCLSYGAEDFLIKPSTYEAGMKIVEYLISMIKG
ncbi:MAG TPA: response regulator [Chryseolinea sp.]